MAWYRSIYAPRTGGAYDSHPRTAGIAGRTRRRGCCVATRGARATGDDAGRSEAKEGLMEKGFAERFAKEWVAAWNSHDLERILDHYEDDFEMSSPIIATLVGERSGKLRGKVAVGGYWASIHTKPSIRIARGVGRREQHYRLLSRSQKIGSRSATLQCERQSKRSLRAL